MFILLPETLTLDYLTNEEEGQYLDRKRIRFVRQFRGLTQTELAEKSGLLADENERIRISQYENGTRVPRKDMLEKLDNRNQVKIKKISMIFHGFYCTLKIPEEKALFFRVV